MIPEYEIGLAVHGFESLKAGKLKEVGDVKFSIRTVSLITGVVGQVVSDRDGEILWQSESFGEEELETGADLARIAAHSKIKSVMVTLFAGDIPAAE